MGELMSSCLESTGAIDDAREVIRLVGHGNTEW